MRFFFILLVATGIAGFADAQPIRIEGRILDASGAPLPGAHVVVEGSRYGTATGSYGQFTLDAPRADRYSILASSVGFQSRRITLDVGTEGVRDVEIRLSELPIEIDEVVVERATLTGGASRVGRIPGSAHYLSPLELERHSHTDVNRVLRTIPGVNVQEEEGYGLRPSIGMRGTGLERNTKITVMEDGVLSAPAPYASPAAYFFPTMGRMQAVEVRKGSSQIKYGPYTTGGALNLISTGIPTALSGRADVIVGSDFMRTLHANVGNTVGPVGFMVEGHYSGSDGFKVIDGGGPSGFERTDLLAKVRVASPASSPIQQSLQLKAGLVVDDSDETYLGLTREDFGVAPFRRYAGSQVDNIRMDQRQVSLRHVIKPASFLDVTTTLYYQDVARNWYKLDAVDPGPGFARASLAAMLNSPGQHSEAYRIVTGGTSETDGPLEVKANNREYLSRGLQSIVGFRGETRGLKHDLELGIRYHEDEEDRIQWVDRYRMDDGVMSRTVAGLRGTDSNQIERAHALAAYGQYRLEIGALGFTPGVRYENIVRRRIDYGRNDTERTGVNLTTRRNTIDVWIPGLSIDYRIAPGILTFAGIHRGFSPPGSGPGADAEMSVSYEVGTRYTSGLASAEVVGFFSDYSNLLGTDLTAGGGEGTGRLFNGGAVHAGGAEASLSLNAGPLVQWVASVPLSINYTYTEARFQSHFRSDFSPWGTVELGDFMPYLPRHQASVSIGAENGVFGIFLSTRYSSRVRTSAGQDGLTSENSLGSSLITDLSAEYAVSRGSRVFASVRNLTDELYVASLRPSGLRPGMPRTVLVGVKTRL
jgi:Fe(3+) dicitrate transport protein